jgi:hypothetical protein
MAMRKTIKELEAVIVRLTDEKDIYAKKYVAERERATVAQNNLENFAKNNTDLKERLHNSEMKVARLEGYMDRVREDDAVSDPLVEVEGPNGKRLVSKRHPAPSHDAIGSDIHDYVGHQMRRQHWTSY